MRRIAGGKAPEQWIALSVPPIIAQDNFGQVQASDDPSFRKAYLRLFMGEVVVGDDKTRMRGPKLVPAKATSAAELPPAAGVVPCFVREWRPRPDSNPRPQDQES